MQSPKPQLSSIERLVVGVGLVLPMVLFVLLLLGSVISLPDEPARETNFWKFIELYLSPFGTVLAFLAAAAAYLSSQRQVSLLKAEFDQSRAALAITRLPTLAAERRNLWNWYVASRNAAENLRTFIEEFFNKNDFVTDRFLIKSRTFLVSSKEYIEENLKNPPIFLSNVDDIHKHIQVLLLNIDKLILSEETTLNRAATTFYVIELEKGMHVLNMSATDALYFSNLIVEVLKGDMKAVMGEGFTPRQSYERYEPLTLRHSPPDPPAGSGSSPG